MYRVEDKYTIEPDKMFRLENRIQSLLSRDVNGSSKGYKISSLYFDDFFDTCLDDVISGNENKDKYRIRIYNDSLSTIKLEVKKKKYNRAMKISDKITKEELWSLCNGDTISEKSSLDDARTLFNLGIITMGLRPKIIVTYERNAYIYQDGNVRITFDRNVRYSTMTDLFGKDIEYDYPNEYNNVLEVKYDEIIPGFLVQTLEMDDMLKTSNSKYGICRGASRLGGRNVC